MLAAIVGAALFASEVRAGHVEPSKAKKASFALVNSFFPCSSPNTATQAGNSASACAPAASDGLCAFTQDGSGKFTMTVVGSPDDGTQAVKFSASAKGLNAFCDSDTLCISLSYRFTTDDCPEGSCTTVDLDNLKLGPPAGCCTVTDGVCKIRATILSSDIVGNFTNGKNTGVELQGCGLAPLFPGIARSAVACGILLK